jgi:hypothetical protein
MQVTLIHNPNAGDDEQPCGDDLLGLIRGVGHTATYQSSRAENWHTALEEPCDIVAVNTIDVTIKRHALQFLEAG